MFMEVTHGNMFLSSGFCFLKGFAKPLHNKFSSHSSTVFPSLPDSIF